MLTYNGVDYTTTSESIYRDMSIEVDNLADATSLCEALSNMQSFEFNGDSYDNMVVTKRAIVITDKIMFKIQLRQKTELEITKEELSSLRLAMEELAQTTSKTTTAKINKILETKAVNYV